MFMEYKYIRWQFVDGYDWLNRSKGKKPPDKGFFNIQNQAAISHAIYK